MNRREEEKSPSRPVHPVNPVKNSGEFASAERELGRQASQSRSAKRRLQDGLFAKLSVDRFQDADNPQTVAAVAARGRVVENGIDEMFGFDVERLAADEGRNDDLAVADRDRLQRADLVDFLRRPLVVDAD